MFNRIIEKWHEKISNESIIKTVDKINELLEKQNIENKERLRIVFAIEESLHFYKEKLGPDCEYEILLSKGFTSLTVGLKLYGNSMNPLLNEEDEYFVKIASFIQGSTENDIKYFYKNGYNHVVCVVSRRQQKSFLSGHALVMSIVAGLFAGMICHLIPEASQQLLLKSFTEPCLKVILGMLSGIMGPVVFLLVISSFISMDSLSTLNSMGSGILRKLIKRNLAVIGVSSLICFAAYRGNVDLFSSFNATGFVTLIIGVIPTNLFKPFTENNIIQIVIISAFTGIVMLMLGLCKGMVADFITELSRIVMHMMKLITRLTPILIFLSIVNTFLKINISDGMCSIKFILLFYASCIALAVLFILNYKLSTGKSVKTLMTVSKAYFVKSFIAGSAVASTPELIAATEAMKTNPIFSKLYISISTVLEPIGNTIFLICSAFFMAEITGATIGPAWFTELVILAIEMSIATPKGAGGILVTVTVLLEQLGNSTDNVGLISVALLLCMNMTALVTAISRCTGLFEMDENFKKFIDIRSPST